MVFYADQRLLNDLSYTVPTRYVYRIRQAKFRIRSFEMLLILFLTFGNDLLHEVHEGDVELSIEMGSI